MVNREAIRQIYKYVSTSQTYCKYPNPLTWLSGAFMHWLFICRRIRRLGTPRGNTKSNVLFVRLHSFLHSNWHPYLLHWHKCNTCSHIYICIVYEWHNKWKLYSSHTQNSYSETYRTLHFSGFIPVWLMKVNGCFLYRYGIPPFTADGCIPYSKRLEPAVVACL